MPVRVDQPGDERCAVRVDSPRLSTRKRLHRVVQCGDPAAPDSHRTSIRMGRVHRVNDGILYDEVG